MKLTRKQLETLLTQTLDRNAKLTQFAEMIRDGYHHWDDPDSGFFGGSCSDGGCPVCEAEELLGG